MTDVWTLTENPAEHLEATTDLWHWSTNYDAGKGPFTLFLDLIGYSADEFGENLYTLGDASGLGYVELDKLGLALREYSARPHDVREWVEQILAAEMES